MLSKPLLAAAVLALLGVAPGAFAQSLAADASAPSGFYGGVALRDEGHEAAGVNLGHLASTWGRFASPVSDDTARRALVFGGYRWANDVAVEGSFTTADRFALRPFDAGVRRGVGLSLVGSPEVAGRSWKADV